jgi:hypothetical protein
MKIIPRNVIEIVRSRIRLQNNIISRNNQETGWIKYQSTIKKQGQIIKHQTYNNEDI